MYRKGNEIMQDAQKGDGKMKRKNGKDQQALLAGMLLKMERLRQGRGQKEVCYGLCVPSYLSKIEHGLVQADPTLLADLFARLDIHYETDPAVCQEGKKALEEYFYRLHYHLEREETVGSGRRRISGCCTVPWRRTGFWRRASRVRTSFRCWKRFGREWTSVSRPMGSCCCGGRIRCGRMGLHCAGRPVRCWIMRLQWESCAWRTCSRESTTRYTGWKAKWWPLR